MRVRFCFKIVKIAILIHSFALYALKTTFQHIIESLFLMSNRPRHLGDVVCDIKSKAEYMVLISQGQSICLSS